MSATLLARATIPGVGVADVRTVDGTVTEVGDLAADPADRTYDLSGYLLLPGLVEPHVHLDKIFSAPTEVRSDAPRLQGLSDAIFRNEASGREDPEDSDPTVEARAERALRRYLSNGTTAVRCHVGCGRGIDTDALAAVLRVRERLRGLIHVQIVADIGWPHGTPWPAHVAHLRSALRAGADLVGGYPSLEADPEAALDACLSVAREFGRGVDFHLDEVTDPDDQDVRQLARLVRAQPLVGTVTASHCVALGCCESTTQQQIAAEIAAAGINVITNPMTNLYLQDRPAAQMRGLTAIGALLDAAVTVAAGSDNVQDAFNPVGRCDPLEIASLLVTAAQCEIDDAFAMVSAAARSVLGLPEAGPRIGAVADLLAIRGGSVTEAVASAPADRMVFTAGRLVARSQVRRWTAEPDATNP